MRLRTVVALAVAAALAAWALWQSPEPPRLAVFVPSGSLMYVEASDFASLVRDWNASQEKKTWIASDNYQVFSRSRLFQRFEGVQGEFAAAAGFPADMPFLDAVAGEQSALALYDIGKLHFLYITRLPSAKVVESALWKARSSYETRQAAGIDYFVHTDKASDRTAAFAVAKDYLLVATREDLLPAALKLIAGGEGNALPGEGWYATAVQAGGHPGEIRMVLNMPALVATPHFRSYWVQENTSELKQYSAAICDVTRSGSGIVEKRVLLRKDDAQAVDGAALGRALSLVPEDASLYRAWAKPNAADAAKLVASRVVEPQAEGGRASEMAPSAPEAAEAGSSGDLETRIDEPPLENTTAGFSAAGLQKVFEGAGVESMAQVGTSRAVPNTVFVRLDSAVAMIGASNWDVNAVRGALAGAAEGGPLGRLVVEAQGKVLLISNSQVLLRAMADRIPKAAEAVQGAYEAQFNLSRERANFRKLVSLIDYAGANEGSEQPAFFSRNMVSLGRTLSRYQSASIMVNDKGRTVEQTVTYRLGK